MADNDTTLGQLLPTAPRPAGIVIAREKDGFGSFLNTELSQLIEHLCCAVFPGLGQFLPGIAIENHRARTRYQRTQRLHALDSRHLVAKVQVGEDADGLVQGSPCRCLTAS